MLCSSLAWQSAEDLDVTLDAVKRAGICVVSLPLVNEWTQDRAPAGPGRTPRWRGITALQELLGKAVPVAMASDNTRDQFYQYGDLDMLEVFAQGVRLGQLDRPISPWPAAVTAVPAAAMHLPAAGTVVPGAAADLVLFRARKFSELLARPQTDRVRPPGAQGCARFWHMHCGEHAPLHKLVRWHVSVPCGVYAMCFGWDRVHSFRVVCVEGVSFGQLCSYSFHRYLNTARHSSPQHSTSLQSRLRADCCCKLCALVEHAHSASCAHMRPAVVPVSSRVSRCMAARAEREWYTSGAWPAAGGGAQWQSDRGGAARLQAARLRPQHPLASARQHAAHQFQLPGASGWHGPGARVHTRRRGHPRAAGLLRRQQQRQRALLCQGRAGPVHGPPPRGRFVAARMLRPCLGAILQHLCLPVEHLSSYRSHLDPKRAQAAPLPESSKGSRSDFG